MIYKELYVTKCVMYIILFLGFWSIIFFLGTVVHNIYLYIKKKKRKKIWPPLISFYNKNLSG